MNLSDKYAPLSEKEKADSKNKIVLEDKDFLLIDALQKLVITLGRRKHG